VIELPASSGKVSRNTSNKNAIVTDVAHLTVKEKICAVLKQEIFDCGLRPGEVLVIDDLSSRFGVSRTPVREALITLCGEGLIEVRQRYGFIVTSVNVKDIVETYSLRILLEKESVRLATRNMGPEDFEKLKALIDVPGTPSGRLFHAFVAASSGWGVLAEVLETLMDKSARSRSLFNNFQMRAAKNDFDSKREHSQIYEAICSRNEEEAVFLMEKHLRGSRDYILKVMSTI
jgi:DNA-binding GntR family transcriptional regulator